MDDLGGVGRDVCAVLAWPDRAIAEIAGRQRGVITRGQLKGLGAGRRAIDYAIARGRLQVLHRGVYSLLPPKALPPLAAEQAALLACGPTALLSHHSAAAIWGIRPSLNGVVDLTVIAKETGRRRRGIHLHRTTHLEPRDGRRHQGLPLTSPARTLTDLAPHLSPRGLERALDEALVKRLTSITAVKAALDDYPHRPGAPNLRALLDPDRPTTVTRSDGEEAFLAMLRRANLPAPEVNARVGDYIADFLWREQKLIVELDGYDYHRTRRAFERDHQRDAEHQHQGFTVIRTTGPQLRRQPEALAIQIATALARAA